MQPWGLVHIGACHMPLLRPPACGFARPLCPAGRPAAAAVGAAAAPAAASAGAFTCAACRPFLPLRLTPTRLPAVAESSLPRPLLCRPEAAPAAAVHSSGHLPHNAPGRGCSPAADHLCGASVPLGACCPQSAGTACAAAGSSRKQRPLLPETIGQGAAVLRAGRCSVEEQPGAPLELATPSPGVPGGVGSARQPVGCSRGAGGAPTQPVTLQHTNM